MDFFKSVFSDDPDPNDHISVSESPKKEEKETEDDDPYPDSSPNAQNSNPNPNSPLGGGGWSFGGLIKTLTTKSESVIETYRRDLKEFGSGLKKETETFREVASRAVKELPTSIEAGASVAQGSLETVGQAIDEFGSSVWKGTAQIVSNSKDGVLAVDHETESSDNQNYSNQSHNSKHYNRFDSRVRAIQNDLITYCEEPEDLDDYSKWKLGFVLEEKLEEVERLFEENGAMEGIYKRVVPNEVDGETFWCRYFYKVYKLKQAEDVRVNLVKRAISRDDEDLSWDVDEDDFEETNVSSNVESGKIVKEESSIEDSGVGDSGVVDEKGENGPKSNLEDLKMQPGRTSEMNNDESVSKSDEKMVLEGRADPGESSKDNDFTVVSNQPSLPEEEDLGWDEIEDLGSSDEKKVTQGGSPNRADLQKRLSAADEEEDLSWDIEDDDEPVKA